MPFFISSPSSSPLETSHSPVFPCKSKTSLDYNPHRVGQTAFYRTGIAHEHLHLAPSSSPGCAIAPAIASSASAVTIDFEINPGRQCREDIPHRRTPPALSPPPGGGTATAAHNDDGSEPDIKAPSGTKVFLPSGGSAPIPHWLLPHER